MPVLDELTHDVCVSLDERRHIRVVGCLGDADTVFNVLDLHVDLIGVTKDLPKKRIAEVDPSPLCETDVHGRHVRLDACRRMIRRRAHDR